MKKRYLKIMSVMLCAAMCSSLAACGSGDSSEGSSDSSTESSSSSDSGKKKGLEIAYNLTTEDFSVFEGIINDFTEETGIDVTIYNGGDDYELSLIHIL